MSPVVCLFGVCCVSPEGLVWVVNLRVRVSCTLNTVNTVPATNTGAVCTKASPAIIQQLSAPVAVMCMCVCAYLCSPFLCASVLTLPCSGHRGLRSEHLGTSQSSRHCWPHHKACLCIQRVLWVAQHLHSVGQLPHGLLPGERDGAKFHTQRVVRQQLMRIVAVARERGASSAHGAVYMFCGHVAEC